MGIEGTARRAPTLEREFYALVPKLHLGTQLEPKLSLGRMKN